MIKWLIFFFIFFKVHCCTFSQEHTRIFFRNISKLEFDSAKLNAAAETNARLKFELLLLADILFYEGQKEREYFVLSNEDSTNDNELLFLKSLNEGYLHLFYDKMKGSAYKCFYRAYKLAIDLKRPTFIKASLMAFFRYYDFEKVQLSESYKPHLDHFEKLKENDIDEVWFTIYKLIFYSKPLKSVAGTDFRYFSMVKSLDRFEKILDIRSPVLVFVYFEQAIKYEIAGDVLNEKSVEYYKRAVAQASDYPFLKDEKFYAMIKLLNIETVRKRFSLANEYLSQAKREVNSADSLRSQFYLNYWGSELLHAEGKNDSAFTLMKKSYFQDLEISHMKNNLEINRLNVELETQEKENANLQLKQNRNWLISALVGVGFLLLTSYFAYANQRSKNRIQAKEKEVQSMKLEKVLKDQEIVGIDAMIEGQEKERQRIASELHDNLGSLLASINLHFHHIKANLEGNEAVQTGMLQKTEDLLSEAYQKVRGIAHAGNVGVNAKDGLLPAVKKFASKVSISNELKIEVKEHGMDQRLENSLEITVFRMIQELIANVIKHAHATEVVISLTHYEQSINLMVEDNGIGFDISQIKPQDTMGLHSIQKRMESLGGSVTVDSIPQKGTSIIIDIPIV